MSGNRPTAVGANLISSWMFTASKMFPSTVVTSASLHVSSPAPKKTRASSSVAKSMASNALRPQLNLLHAEVLTRWLGN